MRIVEVIEAKRWVNSQTGRTASVYGAVPYTSDADKPLWTVETVGWTWRTSDGTIGLGRKPVATRGEALQFMDAVNKQHAEYAEAWAKAMEISK